MSAPAQKATKKLTTGPKQGPKEEAKSKRQKISEGIKINY